MNTENVIQNLDPLDIVLFHVGGVGGYGPVKKVIDMFPKRTVVVCFEANPSKKDKLIQEKYAAKGVRTLFVPKCIGVTSGKQKFYINKHPASSSIFPIAPSAAGNHVLGLDKGIRTWGENCEVDRVIEVDTVTLDELVADQSLPGADILSMDTQGSEMPIMRGGLNVMGDVLSVVCEVDFIQLYQGQDLFATQQTFLAEHGFHLADIMNTQQWHPGPAAGKGFLMMGEALFFRGIQDALTLSKLIKLAAISYAFDRVSFSTMVLAHAFKKFGTEAEVALARDSAFAPMVEDYRYMQKNQEGYLGDSRFFYRQSWQQQVTNMWQKSSLVARIQAGALLRYTKKSIATLVERVIS